MNRQYRVGIYCRLSVDDANNTSKAGKYIPADESVSIENQRELLSKIVMLNGWVEVKTYVDGCVIIGQKRQSLAAQRVQPFLS